MSLRYESTNEISEVFNTHMSDLVARILRHEPMNAVGMGKSVSSLQVTFETKPWVEVALVGQLDLC